MTGRLIGIARAQERMGPMVEIARAAVSLAAGIAGDARGTRPGRQVTVLFCEGWEDACRDVAVALPWVTRRANLYVEGVARPRATGGRIVVGEVELEVAEETRPCALMEKAQAGLLQALKPEWRGGVCCSVVRGGELHIGDAVSVGA